MSDNPFSSRRDFLRGGTAGRQRSGILSLFSLAVEARRAETAAGQFSSDSLGLGPSPNDPTDDSYLVQVGRRAMACQFQIFLNAGQHADGCETAIGALDLVDQLEAQLTIFRGDSEVSEINREAAFGPVSVEPLLFDLFEQSVDLWRQTDGAFDITAGPLSEVWGFARRAGRMPSDEELAAVRLSIGSHLLRLNAEDRTIAFDHDDVKLNLGGIGKGHALDRAAAVLTAAGIDDFLFHGGQSSVLARGSRVGEDSPGWKVGLVHPLRPEQRIGEIRLHDRALSTSGSGTQFFTHRGRRYGHILDPRTGRPAADTLSATVLAPTAAEADALSTALFVLGPARAIEWCQAHPEFSAILMWPGKKAGSLEVATVNVGPQEWRQLAQ